MKALSINRKSILASLLTASLLMAHGVVAAPPESKRLSELEQRLIALEQQLEQLKTRQPRGTVNSSKLAKRSNDEDWSWEQFWEDRFKNAH